MAEPIGASVPFGHQWHDQTESSGKITHAPGLHYASVVNEHRAEVPSTLRATCNSKIVTPRYQFFFVACKERESGCSDEVIRCPQVKSADPSGNSVAPACNRT